MDGENNPLNSPYKPLSLSRQKASFLCGWEPSGIMKIIKGGGGGYRSRI